MASSTSKCNVGANTWGRGWVKGGPTTCRNIWCLFEEHKPILHLLQITINECGGPVKKAGQGFLGNPQRVSRHTWYFVCTTFLKMLITVKVVGGVGDGTQRYGEGPVRNFSGNGWSRPIHFVTTVLSSDVPFTFDVIRSVRSVVRTRVVLMTTGYQFLLYNV